MIESILISNRGEIACRVIRTARRLGIRTIAVYSDADAATLHVELADEAVRIGPASARDSYLSIDAIIEAARRSNASAIHPGYGFLSENPEFAAACRAAGLTFIGPPETAMRAMGSKIDAKRLMALSGVPLVPGYHGDNQDPAHLHAQAAQIGFPVLIKASAGGGGKGMRIVERPADFRSALESAQREARAAFGDDRVLLERFLTRPRHIEIQVFADSMGNCIHLNERDCSIQRRHQKIIEEAPASGMSAERRAAMGQAAVMAAAAVGYQGAGTVEFIVADDEFYFMEMNTRLQVEHPVTEMITGLDLVEWQIRVAAGEALPLIQSAIPVSGHAIEARLYAEDPEREFLPSTGRLVHLHWPHADSNIRIDTGVRTGDEITVHYDPMLAKLIAWGEDRPRAIKRLQHALRECEIVGVTTNLPLLDAVVSHPQFAAGAIDTGFIAEHVREFFGGEDEHEHARLQALAAVGWLLHRRALESAANDRPRSPWDEVDGWRLNLPQRVCLQLSDRGMPVTIELVSMGPSWRVRVGTRDVEVEARITDQGTLDARVNGESIRARLVESGNRIHLAHSGRVLTLNWDDRLVSGRQESHDGGLVSPMPGQVLQVLVKPGVTVRRGQPLVIVEAMKMEHTILSPADGVVDTVNFSAGDRVSEGAQLLRLKPSSGS